MTIRLTVQRQRWRNHVDQVAEATTNLVPVIKGNGYGFGRARLASIAAELCTLLAVGTVHELDEVPEHVTPLVLTPTLSMPPEGSDPVLTVGHQSHIEALAGWGGRVLVKLTSDMHRYGGDIDLVVAAQRAGLRTMGVAIHPPLSGGDVAHRQQIIDWLPRIDPSLDVWVSHLSLKSYTSLPTTHRYWLRTGTHLWLGDRQAISLHADVLDTKPVTGGQRLGYRLAEAPGDGTVVMVGAGTANGVTPLDDGRSPFHFNRTRLALLEPPHMHTSMVFVPAADEPPQIGDWVDLQRPLTMTHVDTLVWV